MSKTKKNVHFSDDEDDEETEVPKNDQYKNIDFDYDLEGYDPEIEFKSKKRSNAFAFTLWPSKKPSHVLKIPSWKL